MNKKARQRMADTQSQEDKRPLSPHLQVYRLPMLAVVSILNRAAGVALSGVLVLLVAWLVALASGPGAFGLVNGFAVSLIGKLMMVAAAFGLGWHGANGVRHLFWDAGKGFSIPAAETSAYLVILFALATGLGAAALLFLGGF